MKNTRLITEGAVLLAVFIILLLATMYVPILNIILLFALPLPFIIFSLKYEWKYALMLLLVASVITILVATPLSITNVLTFGTAGIVIGYLYKKKKNPAEILVTATVIYVCNLVTLYAASVIFFEYNFITQMQKMLNESIAMTERFIAATGANANEKQLQQLKDMPALLGYIMPSMVVLGGFMMSWFTILIAGPILKRLRFQVPAWPPFRDLRLPKSIVIYYVIFILIAAFVKIETGSYLYMAVLNINIIFPLLMALQGFSFLAFLFHSKGYPKGVLIFVCILVLFVPILFSLVTFLGIIDLGFSLRRYIKS
ncbi:YybS family protein [Ectobacillus antri]|uniref:YybS family protein n=1 Tax=Ectobacillus antri TaxID=2486280 RepID=A0ABT6H9I9_9BACI|nr:YybS family protein [Ectobacillus antri]MDG4657567.1 YybS family protein [Ectobacillus antri]MDG5755171.1 YybS family protein [Ectobacillus antri]